MSTGARFSNIVDVLKMGRAFRQPGIDPRVWSTSGRIDPEGNSIRWDSDLGWVIDVIGAGGGFEQEVITAKVCTNNPYEFIPQIKDCEVHVGVPEGEATGNPVILGSMNNSDGCEAPGFVTGMSVDGALDFTPPLTTFDALFGVISPYDNEFKVTPHNRREEYGGDHIDVAENQVLEAVDNVRLAKRDATQSYVRGEDQVDAIIDVLSNFPPFILDSNGLPCTLNSPVWTAPGGRDALRVLLELALSTRIKGE